MKKSSFDCCVHVEYCVLCYVVLGVMDLIRLEHASKLMFFFFRGASNISCSPRRLPTVVCAPLLSARACATSCSVVWLSAGELYGARSRNFVCGFFFFWSMSHFFFFLFFLAALLLLFFHLFFLLLRSLFLPLSPPLPFFFFFPPHSHNHNASHSACYGVLRFIMESGAKGCEVVVSGKLRAQRAKSMKFADGFMIHSGNPTEVCLCVVNVCVCVGLYVFVFVFVLDLSFFFFLFFFYKCIFF